MNVLEEGFDYAEDKITFERRQYRLAICESFTLSLVLVQIHRYVRDFIDFFLVVSRRGMKTGSTLAQTMHVAWQLAIAFRLQKPAVGACNLPFQGNVWLNVSINLGIVSAERTIDLSRLQPVQPLLSLLRLPLHLTFRLETPPKHIDSKLDCD